MRRIAPGLLLLLASPGTAAAQAVVTSPAPDSVDVTIYRAPDRGSEAIDLQWLGGYALVTERRTVTLPAGKAVLRLEGVAGGMLPESALVTGLPGGVREKNLDADLLSSGNLYARAFGRPVILRRQNPKTGEVREERAIVRSGLDGSVIVQTRAGFEAANCGPLNDQLIYEGVPPGLVSKPTLSVETEAPSEARVTLTLSYLAWGFDWQTDYVMQMRPDGRSADLLAWVTLASSDPVSFPDAQAAVVGGEVNREDDSGPGQHEAPELTYHCALSDVAPPPPPPPPPPPVFMMAEAADMVVNAMKAPAPMARGAVMAKQEDLGDLKLYRLPVPTTVASNAQKQVVMFTRPAVKVAVFYSSTIRYGQNGGVEQRLRMQNRKADGLGLPLPAGPLKLFETHDGRPVLAGQGTIGDAPVDQEVTATVATATQVTLDVAQTASGAGWFEQRVTVRNANPWPIAFEGVLPLGDGERIERSSAPLLMVKGRRTWKVRVPANGTVRLNTRLRAPE